MQDRFKFRAYNIRTGEFLNKIDKIGDYSDMEDDSKYFSFNGHKGLYTSIYTGQPKSDWTIMQCTGLKDKNGKLIYEGDILRNAKTGELRTVEWHGTMAGYVWSNPIPNSYLYKFGALFRAFDKYEIVGNIYEPPELLEKQQK